jgi:hypothetical protein
LISVKFVFNRFRFSNLFEVFSKNIVRIESQAFIFLAEFEVIEIVLLPFVSTSFKTSVFAISETISFTLIELDS